MDSGDTQAPRLGSGSGFWLDFVALAIALSLRTGTRIFCTQGAQALARALSVALGKLGSQSWWAEALCFRACILHRIKFAACLPDFSECSSRKNAKMASASVARRPCTFGPRRERAHPPVRNTVLPRRWWRWWWLPRRCALGGRGLGACSASASVRRNAVGARALLRCSAPRV